MERKRRFLAYHWQRFKSRVTPSNIRASFTLGSVKKKDESLRLTEVNSGQQNGTSQRNLISFVGDQREGSLGESGREDGESSFASRSVAVDIESNGSVHSEEIRPAGASDQPINRRSSRQSAISSARSSRERGRNVPHTEIDMESGMGENQQKLEPTYIETHAKISYWQCLSPLRLEEYSGGIWGLLSRFLGYIQLFVYGIGTLFSILRTFGLAKLHFFSYINYGGLDKFINMCLYAMGVLTKIYLAYLQIFQQAKLNSALKEIQELRELAKRRSPIAEPKYSSQKLLAFVLFSQTISIMSVVFSKQIVGWTPEKAILHRSFHMAQAIEIWTPADLHNNGTGLVELEMKYGTNLTTTNAALGGAGFLAQIFHRMQTDALDTQMLVTAITLYKEILQLTKEIENPDYDIYPVTVERFEAPDGAWEHFQKVKEAMEKENLAVNDLLKYWHVENLAVILFMILEAFDGDFGVCLVLYYVFTVIKFCCTYRIAIKVSEKNGTYRKWIRRLTKKSNDTKFVVSGFLIMDELKEEPLGLGKGMFMIDEGFLFRFLGTVGSVCSSNGKSGLTDEIQGLLHHQQPNTIMSK